MELGIKYFLFILRIVIWFVQVLSTEMSHIYLRLYFIFLNKKF